MQQIDNLADSIDSIYHIVICIFYISHYTDANVADVCCLPAWKSVMVMLMC